MVGGEVMITIYHDPVIGAYMKVDETWGTTMEERLYAYGDEEPHHPVPALAAGKTDPWYWSYWFMVYRNYSGALPRQLRFGE